MGWTTPMSDRDRLILYEKQKAEARARFTWEDAAHRLAEQTEWTMTEARWVDELEPTGLHPFDVIDQLVLIFRRDWTSQGKMRAIKNLIEMAVHPPMGPHTYVDSVIEPGYCAYTACKKPEADAQHRLQA